MYIGYCVCVCGRIIKVTITSVIIESWAVLTRGRRTEEEEKHPGRPYSPMHLMCMFSAPSTDAPKEEKKKTCRVE